MKSSELREKFLKYFESNGHMRLPSSSLVPANDPTLFFTNAGMVQFKDLFLGNEKRDYTKATTSQKCMRVSGKHNDLEQVGLTPRHHTFFEMLGNFSFGDYFKKEAIVYGWEFLTKTVGIPKDRLYITIFEDDDEAEKLWARHIAKDRIFRLGEKDNFWAMGDTGPCGPCSEIHFDRAPTGKVTKKDLESDRFMEVWNLVFMQFERGPDGKRKKLARPSIDTGMGLERLASIVEGVEGNYETDLFMPIIGEIEKITGKQYCRQYEARSTKHEARSDFSIRVIADHIRASVFLIGDGIHPSNEGRGYVLRRIIRRAIRHGKLLGQDKPFFAPIAHIVINEMGSAYPEVIQHRAFIEKVIASEEIRFYETLNKGLEMLEATFEEIARSSGRMVPGDVVFKLYDTYGFPKDLTADIASEHGMAIDDVGFEKLMDAQRQKARAAWKGSGEEKVEGVYKELKQKGIKSNFVGYEKEAAEARVVAVLAASGERLAITRQDSNTIQFITDITPFYGETGGQVGDTGTAVSDDGLVINITDAKRPLSDIIVHYGTIEKGVVKEGQKIKLAIDSERRAAIRRNHTATHLLHKALREVLGEHVKQAGSYVGPDRLRFDFNHVQALSENEIRTIESEANEIIRKNLTVSTSLLAYDDAVKKGAVALFGERYGERVRLVEAEGYSMELCGGTHVTRTGDIGAFKITSESSVAAGMRRIEALTGSSVEEYISTLEHQIQLLAQELKVGKTEVFPRVKKLTERVRQLEKQIGNGTPVTKEVDIKESGGIKYVAQRVEAANPAALRNLADQHRQKLGSGVVVLAVVIEDKVSLIVAVTKDLIPKINAGDILKKLVPIIGGTGGGRSDMAQGGGPDVSKSDELLNSVESILASL